VEGSQAVKARGELYLPNPNKEASDADERYKAYRLRSLFVNMTARTRNGLVGMAFRKAPQVDIPTNLDYIEENATGDGVSLEQLGKNTVGHLLEVGRYGLLADYPKSESGLSAAQVRDLRLQANIKPYKAENIINWKTQAIGGVVVLSLVVLKEEYDISEDEFDTLEKYQYRVLRLVDGVYTMHVYRDGAIYEETIPTDAAGVRFSEIPFVIAGAYSNDPEVDDAPLYDLAEINIAHYRNSADYEEGVFIHGQPMLHIDIGTTTADQWTKLNPKGVMVGSRQGITTAGGGSAQLLQAQSNAAAFEAMEHKEKQAIALGARLIEDSKVPETATAAMMKYAGDNSVLSNVAQNASEAITKALTWCAQFMGADENVVFEINQDFYDKTLSAQEIIADIQLLDRGVIAKSDMRNVLRKVGKIEMERTDEEIDSEAEDISPVV
jgi:hypothetical protein